MLDVRKPTAKDATPDRVAVVTMADGAVYTIGMKPVTAPRIGIAG